MCIKGLSLMFPVLASFFFAELSWRVREKNKNIKTGGEEIVVVFRRTGGWADWRGVCVCVSVCMTKGSYCSGGLGDQLWCGSMWMSMWVTCIKSAYQNCVCARACAHGIFKQSLMEHWSVFALPVSAEVQINTSSNTTPADQPIER